MEIIVQIILLVVGFTMLIKGADWFVEGASGTADKFGIPQIVIGLTIVAFGTSAPEAAVSITAAVSGNGGISIGNVVGSNILNILVILGLTAVINPVHVEKSMVRVQIPFMIGISILLLALGSVGNEIGLLDGVIMWVVFLGFLIYLIQVVRKENVVVEESSKNKKLWKLLLATVVGLGIIVWGSNVTVGAAKSLARMMGLSERFIGLTIVALGTSLPELCTSVVAAKLGKADIAVGNIVGSNIFNILFVLGTTALITPITFEAKFFVDATVAIVASILLWVCSVKTKKLNRLSGAIMLLCYGGYFVYLIA